MCASRSNDSATDRGKLRQQLGDRPIVVGGGVGLSILQIGRMELLRAGIIIIEPLVP